MSKAWFSTKRDGFPAGTPISWKGWGILGLFFAGMMLASQLAFALAPAEVAPFWAAGASIVVLIVFCLVIRSKTESSRRKG